MDNGIKKAALAVCILLSTFSLFSAATCISSPTNESESTIYHPDYFLVEHNTEYYVSPTGNDITGDGSYENPWRTIQHAINSVDFGDTIHVLEGSYTENVKVNKSVSLIGAGKDSVTVSAAISYDYVFDISEDYVNIAGFKVTGGTDSVGVYLHGGADHCTISDNNVTNNGYGIYLLSSNGNTLINNSVHSNNDRGIYLSSSSDNNTLINNTVKNNDFYGIYLGSSSGNNITGNTITNNKGNGIYLTRSSERNNITNNNIMDNNGGIYGIGIAIKGSNNLISGNTITNHNKHGILLTESTLNIISGNTIANNSNTGIYLKYSSYNNIIRNLVANNTNKGIYLEATANKVSSNNEITENNIKDNQCGLLIIGISCSNIIYHNNFIDNNQNANDTSGGLPNFWDNWYPSGGNYWDDFDEPNEGAYDDYQGEFQDAPGADGFVDMGPPTGGLNPYNIPGGNHQDRYPLIREYTRPPYPPHDPDPYEGEINVSVHAILSWIGGDPDSGDTVTYDIYFGTTTPPPKIVNNQTMTFYELGILDYETQYFWQIVAWDNHEASTEGALWYYTTEQEPEPDLDCDGILSWTGVEPGDTVTGSFTVENNGEPSSELNWEISDYPDWGTWMFIPSNGNDLTPENGAVTVEVSVVAPDESEKEFSGVIKIVNSEDPSDYCIIDVSLATPVNQHSIIYSYILQFLERLMDRFPLLEGLLQYICYMTCLQLK